METLKLINSSSSKNRLRLQERFIDNGVIQDRHAMESLLDMIVTKTCIEPAKQRQNKSSKKQVDVEANEGKPNLSKMLQKYDVPLNLCFAEATTLETDFDEKLKLDTRRWLTEYCFEELGCNSLSFVKQASVHLFSD